MSPVLRTLFLVSLVACAVLGAAPASALGALTECEDEISEELVAPEPARVILPCGVAEQVLLAGDLACADATIYVLTHSGTLLCELDVPALGVSTAPALERAPSATLSSSSAFSAAGLAPAASQVPPPLVVDLPRARPLAPATPRDGFVRPPALPS